MTFEGAADQPSRHAHVVVTPHAPNITTNFPSTALLWTGPNSSTLTVGQTITVRMKLKLDTGSNTYANVSVIQLTPVALRGLAVHTCTGATGMCLMENDGEDGTQGTKNDVLTPGTTVETEISVTKRAGGVWESKVGRAGKVLNQRATGGLPNDAAGVIKVLVGGANTGGNGSKTGVEIDDVVVTITGP
ncbi:MAG: hypothetical protein KIT84_25115 [Labilithrix sp.]|nr:hypothetical protein [Labilithrix sp.]MCW5814332.1 hypothetical protein [Labilithrix sp.]